MFEAVESAGSFNGLHRNGDARGIQREHENDDQGSPSPNHNTKNEEIQYQSRLKGGIYGYYNRIIGISHLRFSVNLNIDITNQLHRAHFPPRLLSSSGSCVRIWSERRWLSILVELCTGTGQSWVLSEFQSQVVQRIPWKRHGLGYAVGTSQKYRFQPKGCGGQLGGKLHSFTWASGHIGASMFHIDPAFQSCLGSVVGVVRMQVGVT